MYSARKGLYYAAATTAIIAVVLVGAASQSWIYRANLDWISQYRGPLLQAIIYAAQTVLLILVLWASLTQLTTLEKSVHSNSLEGMFSAQREIARLAADKPETIARLATEQAPPQATNDLVLQIFADTLINYTYSIFLQHKLSAVPSGYWESAIKSAANAFALPYVKRRWEKEVKEYYEPDFREFVNSLIRGTPS